MKEFNRENKPRKWWLFLEDHELIKYIFENWNPENNKQKKNVKRGNILIDQIIWYTQLCKLW